MWIEYKISRELYNKELETYQGIINDKNILCMDFNLGVFRIYTIGDELYLTIDDEDIGSVIFEAFKKVILNGFNQDLPNDGYIRAYK